MKARLKVGVITFPGSNCDHDMLTILNRFFRTETELLWHANAIEGRFALLVLPGGFSYGDYLRSGAIARFAPAMGSLLQHAKEMRPVLGICNGFQILCEAGLLPGALIRNENLKHVCKSVTIRPHSTNPFTKQLKSEYTIPVSHSEGNYRVDSDTLNELEEHGQIAFRYAENPNGSVFDIAGVMDRHYRILGMMPHPERAVDPVNGSTDGTDILNSFLSLCI